MTDRLREARDQINEQTALPPPPERVRAARDVLQHGLIADGGNLELVRVDEDGPILLDLQGNCASCPAQAATIQHVMEPHLKDNLPGVSGIVVS